MKFLKKFVALATFAAMIVASAHHLSAQEYYTDTGGCGYQECRRVPSLAPAIALGTIAIIAIVAVAVQNSNHHHHSHSHG
jgi:uncharacterized membrane protein